MAEPESRAPLTERVRAGADFIRQRIQIEGDQSPSRERLLPSGGSPIVQQAAAAAGDSSGVGGPSTMGPNSAARDEEGPADFAELNRQPDKLWGSLLGDVAGPLVGGPSSVRHPWLHVDAQGTGTLVEVDKHRIVTALGIRYRDLLALDPSVPIPFPAAILIREKALVVNLETVRMIICSNQCYVLSVPKSSDPRMATFPCMDNPFVHQLCKCLRTGKSTATLHDLSKNSASFDFDAPYELRALEVALATVTNLMDREVFELESTGYPVIDRLANDVSKGVLEDVRKLKHAVGKAQARVQRIRTELEEILDDDADMQDMYLARRAMLLGEEPPPNMVGIARAQVSRCWPLPAAATARAEVRGQPGARLHGGSGVGHHTSTASLPGTAGAGDGHPDQHLAHSESVGALEGPAAAGGAAHRHRQRHADAAEATGGGHVPEHLGHHPRSRGDLSAHGGRGGGGGRGLGQYLRRGSTLVRTVRTLKRRNKGRGSGVGSPTAAAAADKGEAAAGEQAPLLGSALSAPASITPGEDRTPSEPSDDGDEVIETFIEGPAMPGCLPCMQIEDAEDLLEAYFLQVDYLLRRLQTVDERIEDTEDLVAIQMDHRRNELVATDLMVTTGTAGFAWVAMIAGLFGMNLNSGVEELPHWFWTVFSLSLVGGATIVAVIVAWIRYRRLMFIPSTL
ncbi:hypothetical protein ABPG77_001300 [Micractinium sp. CCAP 211/92]